MAEGVPDIAVSDIAVPHIALILGGEYKEIP